MDSALCIFSFQVNLGRLFKIRGVATQGRHDNNQWVTRFSVSYTADDLNWVYIREDSQIKVIKTEKKRWLTAVFGAKYWMAALACWTTGD